MYQKDGKAVVDVYSHINVLFKDSPDLMDEFKQFLPETANSASLESTEITNSTSFAALSNGNSKSF